MIQRARYDRAQATLIVNVKGAYRQYCGLPVATFDRLMTAPSMGQFFKVNIEGGGSGGPYGCADRPVPKPL
jgi:KTSC domain-containing protein